MHVIRLRYPWEKQVDGAADWVKVDVPEPQRASTELATWNYRRHFNLPSGLRADSRVTLRLESWQGRLEQAAVNGVALPLQRQPFDAEITPHLLAHNVVSICLVDLPNQPARLDGTISLAIHEVETPG